MFIIIFFFSPSINLSQIVKDKGKNEVDKRIMISSIILGRQICIITENTLIIAGWRNGLDILREKIHFIILEMIQISNIICNYSTNDTSSIRASINRLVESFPDVSENEMQLYDFNMSGTYNLSF